MQTDFRTQDEDGVEFATPLAARAEAIRTCGQMMKEAAESFWDSRPWSIVVTDAAGLILWEISMDGYSAPATAAP